MIGREEVRRLAERGAQLVDVLPAEVYQESHLPGAINLPLPELDRKTADRLRRDQPILVYCNDGQ
jgi:rhodanese-related sulfurtransferase